jgi:nitrogen regulatory protein P-II 2
LQLTPDQEKHWPAVEDAIRPQPKTRYQGAPFAERGDVDPIERLRERANATAQQATALKKLADAWQPLYQSLDPDQKMQMRVLRDLIMRDAEDASLQGAAMKFVSAVIQPFKLDEVRDALNAIGVHEMTVAEVKDYGRQKGHKEIYRGAEYNVNFVPKVRLDIALPQDQVEQVVETINKAARTGQMGDTTIFITSIDQGS